MIFLRCEMWAGGFSGEIVFEIKVHDGKHSGTASRRYFWNKDSTPLGARQLSQKVPGFVVARIIEQEESQIVLVSIPDGEIVRIKRNQIVPAEPSPNVPVRS